MATRKLRKEKDCLNCGTLVEDRFCPHCGQENREIRPSFRRLFTQFFIDFVNYDDGFLRTIKMILLKPGATVSEFLEGKRQRNFPPAKMVIFVSFFAFLLPFILPDFQKEKKKIIAVNKTEKEAEEFSGLRIDGEKSIKTLDQLDELRASQTGKGKMDSLDYAFYKSVILQPEKYDSLNYVHRTQTDKIGFNFSGGTGGLSVVTNEYGLTFNKYYRDIKTLEDFELIDKNIGKEARFPWHVRIFVKKEIELRQRGMTFFSDGYNEMIEKTFISNLSKVAYLYLPFFALLLALFHSRKKWKLYDHGIHTLYYFSFLLIWLTLLSLFNFIISPLALFSESWDNIIYIIQQITSFLAIIYAVYYFYRANRVVYQERKAISRLKSTLLVLLNTIFIVFLTVSYTIWTLLIV